MATHEISLIAMDIRKWDLETQKLALTSYFVINNEERSVQFEISLLQPPDMVEEFLGKLKYTVARELHSEGEETPEIEIESETFLRQKLYNYFRKILMELNNPRRKKGQPKMIYSTHMDVYNENQDISFLPPDIQFFVILNWARRYYEREEYQKAIEPLKRLLKLKPDFGLGYKWLARSLKKIRKFEEAMRMYEKYAEVDGSLDSLLDLAKSYRKGKIFDKSEAIYHDILQKYPGEKEARIGLAQIKYARKEPDFIDILDELHQEDPEWLKEWLTEEFNFRIYVPEKTMLSPIQAAKFLGFDKVLDLTQKAFKNEVPSHFNPAKARLTFYREELENWAKVMNRYNALGEEVKLYPERLENLNGHTLAAKETATNAAPLANDANNEAEEKPKKLTRVEEILMKIRARREELGLPEPPKRKRGRPRKSETQAAETQTTTEQTTVADAETAQPVKRKRGRPRKSETQTTATTTVTPEETTEAAEEKPKRRRGRPRKSETQAAETQQTTEQATVADAEAAQPVKRKRGRPRKSETQTTAATTVTPAETTEAAEEKPKRRRGRPRKAESDSSNGKPSTMEVTEPEASSASVVEDE